MNKIIIYIFSIIISAGCFLSPTVAFAEGNLMGAQGALRLVYLESGDVQITNPEIIQSFYDELKGSPRDYFIESSEDFELYINLLTPKAASDGGIYSADVFLLGDPIFGLEEVDNKIVTIDGTSSKWESFYESSSREYYLKGPELLKQLSAGSYKIEVYSPSNQGKYVLRLGREEFYDWKSILNIFWQLPLLKLNFFKTDVLEFFLTPFGIAGVGAVGALLVFLALINYLVGVIKVTIKHNQAKTLLLTSAGMRMKDDILKLLQKPAYDVEVAFIMTAYKYKLEDNPGYKDEDIQIMKDIGFNVEEVDIEGKSEHQVMDLLKFKDIVFVAGGNAFYLLKAMRACNFEKVIRKLLQYGKVYVELLLEALWPEKLLKLPGGLATKTSLN